MNESVSYCRFCNKIGASGYSLNGGYTFSCSNCESTLDYLTGIQVIGHTIVAVGQVTGDLVIPEGVEGIFLNSFEDTAIKSVVIPSSLKEIPFQCFKNCTNLKKIIIKGNPKINSCAFEGCDNLKEVVLSSAFKTIDSFIFQNFKSLERITIPEGVEEIGGYAFNDCVNLKEIIIPSTIKKIGACAFSGCTSLHAVIIEGNPDIETCAFSRCVNLEEVILSSKIERIGRSIFNECINLKQITIPEGIKEICIDAFENCQNLQLVRLPSSLKKIEDALFDSSPFKLLIIPRGSQAEQCYDSKMEFIKSYGPNGYLLSAPIIDNVLYYTKPKNNVINVPSGVETIESFAATDIKSAKRIILPHSVKVIKSNAFSNCKHLEGITFGDQIEIIESKAFAGLKDQRIDLPPSIKELAPDAFGDGCVVSIGGTMPFYAQKSANINKLHKDFEEKQKIISKTKNELQKLEDELDIYIKSVPKEFAKTSEVHKQILVVEQKLTALNCQIKELNDELSELTKQYKKTFFLATSKKKEIETLVEIKRSKLQPLKNTAKDLTEESLSLKHKYDELIDARNNWENVKQSRTKSIEDKQKFIKSQEIEVSTIKSEIKQAEKSLEMELMVWQQACDSLARRQKTNVLLAEKKTILSTLKLPEIEAALSYTYQPNGVYDEELLNNAFLAAIDIWNKINKATACNEYIEKHYDEIQRVKELNKLLEHDEYDGILEFQPQDTLDEKICLPDRFVRLNTWFAQFEYWKTLKSESKGISSAKMPKKNIFDKFFVDCDYLKLSSEKEFLLVLPYCIVECKEGKPLAVYSIDNIKISIKSIEQTVSDDEAPQNGEFLKEEYLHLNQDGTPSKRYKYNPIIKMYRFTNLVIKTQNEKITIPVKTYNTAVIFEAAFNSYQKAFVNGEFHDISKFVYENSEWIQIDAELDRFDKAKKEQLKEQKQKEKEERLAKQAAAEAERKLIEEARLAAKIVAEEKRKALIQRQKELNEERRQQAEDKKKRLSMFDDDFTDAMAKEETTASKAEAPLKVIGKQLISNNVFKVNLAPISQMPRDAICYFVATDGSLISNKKKLSLTGNDEIMLGFVLVSGIDYTSMNSCKLRIESQNELLGEIDFKMSIAFSSDF